jgi:hypothetical protein
VGPNGRSATELDVTLDYTDAIGSWALRGWWINDAFAACRWTDIECCDEGSSSSRAGEQQQSP